MILHCLSLCLLALPGFDATGGEKQDVPAETKGKLLFIGTEIKPGETAPTGEKLQGEIAAGKYVQVSVGTLVVELAPEEKVPADQTVVLKDQPDKKYRHHHEGEEVRPGKVRVAQMTRLFRKLEV